MKIIRIRNMISHNFQNLTDLLCCWLPVILLSSRWKNIRSCRLWVFITTFHSNFPPPPKKKLFPNVEPSSYFIHKYKYRRCGSLLGENEMGLQHCHSQSFFQGTAAFGSSSDSLLEAASEYYPGIALNSLGLPGKKATWSSAAGSFVNLHQS